MSATSPAEALAQGIARHCDQKSLFCQRDPQELLKQITKATELRLRLSHETRSRMNDAAEPDTDFPTIQASPPKQLQLVEDPIGFLLKTHSSYAVQIGTLESTLFAGEWTSEYESDLIGRWQGYQQYAAIARTWLSADYNDDLSLFLVGPAGSNDQVEWKAFSQTVERNDLVCRKLVWLPSRDPSDWPAEIVEFLDRTFLAEPWLDTSQAKSLDLDSLSVMSDEMRPWQAVMNRHEFQSEDRDSDAFVAALIEAFES